MVSKIDLLGMVFKPPHTHLDFMLAKGEVVAGDGKEAVMRMDEPDEVRLGEMLGDANIIGEGGDLGADGLV
jgi:hypothetical protein